MFVLKLQKHWALFMQKFFFGPAYASSQTLMLLSFVVVDFFNKNLIIRLQDGKKTVLPKAVQRQKARQPQIGARQPCS